MINIMLVDDDKLTVLVSRKMLERASDKFEVSVYINAFSALKVLKAGQESPDAILLDINMPEMSGWKFLSYLNQIGVSTDVIMLTASVEEKHKLMAKKYPQVKGFFKKPLNKEKIIKLLKYYGRP